MKHTTSITELTGINKSPIGGTFIVSSNRDFINRHVVIGSSVLYNKTTGTNAVVTAVTATRIDAAVDFKPGDLFLVTLDTPWEIQTNDGLVIEVECNRCGFSYPSTELNNGLCKTCQDEV